MSVTTNAAAACTFSCCVDTRPGHQEHTWTDSVSARVENTAGTVCAYAVVDETGRFNDSVLIGIQRHGDQDTGSEG